MSCFTVSQRDRCRLGCNNVQHNLFLDLSTPLTQAHDIYFDGRSHCVLRYVCSQLNTPHVDAGNPTNKQQWLFIPVHGQNQVYHLVAVDHMSALFR